MAMFPVLEFDKKFGVFSLETLECTKSNYIVKVFLFTVHGALILLLRIPLATMKDDESSLTAAPACHTVSISPHLYKPHIALISVARGLSGDRSCNKTLLAKIHTIFPEVAKAASI